MLSSLAYTLTILGGHDTSFPTANDLAFFLHMHIMHGKQCPTLRRNDSFAYNETD